MRKTAAAGGVTVKAYAGTTGVLVAFDVEPERRAGLLGFAIERREGEGPWQWLLGKLGWEGEAVAPGQYFRSDERPYQKFRWSDYRVEPGRSYRYRVHPVYGSPAAPRVEAGPSVAVRAAALDAGAHRVLFNRAAAASQAFGLKFPTVEAEMDAARKAKRPYEPPRDVLAWLTRGVLGEIVGMLRRATGPAWALDVAIYEYEDPDIRRELLAARERGVRVRLVYHAKPGDPQTAHNEEHVAELGDAARGRVTSKIFHQKFVVLSKLTGGDAEPVAVLTGSTNFTHNGIYRQANVVHVAEDAGLAGRFAALFEQLWAGRTVGQTRAYVDADNPLDLGAAAFAGFSPRSKLADLAAIAAKIGGARRDVLFCTAFDLSAPIVEALLGTAGDDVIRLGVQNKRQNALTGVHRDRTASFSAAAMLNKGLEGFLKESLAGQRGSTLIHTKLVVLDFTSDAPTVISGSHNLSVAASGGNDENFLVVNGDTDVADCYGVELMRIYDPYRFRFAAKQGAARPALTRGDAWTKLYFKRGSLSDRDRRYFAGRA